MRRQFLKACVIGLGRIGWAYDRERGSGSSHVGAYLQNGEVDTVIGVDVNEERLGEFNKWASENINVSVIGVKDYVEAVKEYQPNIVSVCVPTSVHKQIMLDLCHKDGPDIICLEKPVAESVASAQEIANRAAYVHGLTKDSGRGKPKVAVNFSRRWHPNWVKVKELLDTGKIGKPLLAVGHHPGPLLRSGVHMLDLFNWYFGEVEQARSLSFADSWMTARESDTDDVAYNAEIWYKNKVRAILLGADLAATDYQLFDFYVYGEKGAISVCDNGHFLMELPLGTDGNYGGLLGLSPSQAVLQEESKVNMLSLMVDDLVECVKDTNRYPKSGLEDGVNAQILVSMIRQSKGNWTTPNEVDWKEQIRSL